MEDLRNKAVCFVAMAYLEMNKVYHASLTIPSANKNKMR